MIKEWESQKAIRIVNICVTSTRASKYNKQIITDLKGEKKPTNNCVIIVSNSITHCQQWIDCPVKMNKERLNMNHTSKLIYLIGI